MNKIYIYKINGEYVAVVATCNYVARQGLDQKFGTDVAKQFQYECNEIVQVQGTFQVDLGQDDVKVISEELEEIKTVEPTKEESPNV